MEIILRRTFLQAAGFGALVPALVPPPSLDAAKIGNLEAILTAAPAQNRRISFEEALADRENKKELRQKYLEQLVRNSPYSQYIDGVVYDHDFSQAIKTATDTKRVYGNQELLDYTLNEYLMLNEPTYYGINSSARMNIKKSFLNSITNRNSFNDYLTIKNKRFPEFVKKLRAMLHAETFGRKDKPILYVFGSSFNPITLYGPKGPIIVPPTESRLFTTLAHEGTHTEDEYGGISLSGVPSVTNANYLDIHPGVFSFVKEIRGYLNGIEKATQLENPNKIYLVTNNFERLPPAYLSAVMSLHQYFVDEGKLIEPAKLSFADRLYVTNQLDQVRKRAPEMIVQQDVRNFFQKFGM